MAVSAGSMMFQNFVRRVHRRQVALRLVEGAGLGTLGGCAAALPLVGILLWRGTSPIDVAVGGPAIGAAAGLLWAILARPTQMAAALEADRQLGWNDLLSSAISIQPQFSNDSWAAAVRATADLRCSGVSPSKVILHRLGARTLGGIGLATALVLALGSIPTLTSPTRADNQDNPTLHSFAMVDGPPPQTVGSSNVPRRSSTQQEPEEVNSRTTDESGRATLQGANPDSATDTNSRRSAGSDQSSGTGAGASHSTAATTPPKPLPISSGTEAQENSNAGRPGGGAGHSSTQLPGAGDSSGQSAGISNRQAKVAPPWQSAAWPADSKRADAAINNGRIPDSYRDVIRGYFE